MDKSTLHRLVTENGTAWAVDRINALLAEVDRLEQAQCRFYRADGRTTQRVYRRRAERVKPGRGV